MFTQHLDKLGTNGCLGYEDKYATAPAHKKLTVYPRDRMANNYSTLLEQGCYVLKNRKKCFRSAEVGTTNSPREVVRRAIPRTELYTGPSKISRHLLC